MNTSDTGQAREPGDVDFVETLAADLYDRAARPWRSEYHPQSWESAGNVALPGARTLRDVWRQHAREVIAMVRAAEPSADTVQARETPRMCPICEGFISESQCSPQIAQAHRDHGGYRSPRPPWVGQARALLGTDTTPGGAT